MADIFYKTGGNFSTATPQKVVSSQIAFDSTDAANTARYIDFTPSEAGDVEGVFLCLNIGSNTAANNVTVNLQDATVDVAGATKTLYHTDADIHGSFGVGRNSVGNLYTVSGNYMWTYFEFATPATVTTDASRWRIKILSNNATTNIVKLTAGTLYSHAVVLTATTSYTSGDTAFFKNFETFDIDQSITLTSAIVGTQAKFNWQAPVASYTLTITTLYQSKNFQLYVGTEASPIPYAQQAIIDITSWTSGAYWTAPNGYEYCFYGEKPVGAFGYLASDANSGQAKATLTVDKSSTWTVGDTVHLTGSIGGWQSKTIDSFSGAELTLDSNLTNTHYSEYAVVNVTVFEKMGIKLKIGNPQMTAKLKLSGVLMDSILTITANSSSPCYDRVEPYLFDTIYFPTTIGGQTFRNNSDTSVVKTSYSNGRSGTIFKDIYVPTTTAYTYFSLYFGAGQAVSLENVFFTSTTSYAWASWDISDSTLTNFQGSGSSETTYRMCYWTFTGCTINDSLFMAKTSSSGGVLTVIGNVNTFNRCKFDWCLTAITFVSGVDNIFYLCEFGQKGTVTNTIGESTNLFRVVFNNCKGLTSINTDTIATSVLSSYVKVAQNNQSTDDHKDWFKYGKTQSTGDGLTDTTVHTSGTGKFALRFEPTSSTNSLTWDIDVPTGDISTKTMTVSVWCKINSATYYAGTHQLPRLTIDYDNGTTAYHQAGETTDWQLLFVSFTPTTTYGQITVTLSGRTDATSTDAYIYWDDFGVAYPPSVSLDLGGMDYWANGLPVTPPIALPISAGTVAQQVWQQLTTTSWGTDSMGEQVKSIPAEIKYIDSGESPIY